MNAVKNLCKMDLRILGCCRGTLFLYGALAVAMSISTRTATIGYVIAIYLLLYTAAAYTDQSRGGYLAGSLPVSRGQIVLAKYLLDLGALITVNVLVAVVNLIAGAFAPASFNTVELFPLLCLQFFVGAMMVGIMQPLVLYLGTVRARYYLMAIYLIIFFITYNLVSISDTPRFTGMAADSLSAALVPAGLMLLLVSFIVATALYSKKQFTE